MENSLIKNTKKIIGGFILILNYNLMFCQAPGWSWSFGATGYYSARSNLGSKITTDIFGNTYFLGDVYLGVNGGISFTMGNYTLTDSVPFSIILKVSTSGNVIWVKKELIKRTYYNNGFQLKCLR